MPWLEDLKFPRGYQMGTHINLKEKIKTVITDHSIDSSYVQELNNQNIQVITI